MSIIKYTTIIGGVVAATALVAQPYIPKGEVEGWKIFVNEANNSCFMETTTEEGLIMQMGSGGDIPMGYLALYTEGTTDILDGETRVIEIKLGEQMFSGEAEGIQKDGYSGGYFLGNNPLLGFDLATQSTMIVNPNGTNVFSVDLAGAAAAMSATRACQADIKG